VTLGLAGVIDQEEAEAIIERSVFDPPERTDVDGLHRFCVGPDAELHGIYFP
jgi:hypothetical protein